jgi:D-galacturonate reductase
VAGEKVSIMKDRKKVDVTIIGAGMIVHDLILPSIYQLQRMGIVGRISVCGTRSDSLRALRDNAEINDAFPGQNFTPYPDPDAGIDGDNTLYQKVLATLQPHQAVIIALPDQLHYPVIMDTLNADQHILCVKPLVMTHREGESIARRAREKGLFVGVEYHKRFDHRSLLARKHYRSGDLGELVIGEAKMIEPYHYRFSNFQNWFTADQTDPFVYVGCHYVDQVYFITGLRPVEVSVSGIKGTFPNGNQGYMWANGRIRFENGALLSVTNGLGYPDLGAGSNEQGLSLFFEGDQKAMAVKHNDQFRGVEYAYSTGRGAQKKIFHYVNPDFFQLIPWEGDGLKPIGYGVDSVSATIEAVSCIEAAVGKNPERAHEIRLELRDTIDKRGLIATPENAFINELVHEAARASIRADGDMVFIDYDPVPKIRLKHGS